MKKRGILITVTLAALLFFGVVFQTTEAKAASEGLYHYTVSNGEATLDTCYASLSGNITIPSTLGGYPVTAIGNYAFEYCVTLTSVTIPDSVTSIGMYAFYNCQALVNITIPDSVTYIGEGAFYNCNSLENVTLPNSLTQIKDYAFYECRALKNVTILGNATYIGDYAFYNCSALEKITIPNSVTSIGKYAFYNCSSLTSVNIPNGITSIERCTFYNCRDLERITIPNSVTSIGEYAFYCCTSLTSISIPNSVTSIGKWVFSGCSSATSITIPEGITTIPSVAFSNCSSVISITIPDSVTSIGQEAFSNCSSLISITIPNRVTNIGSYAFSYCTSLTSVILPDSITSIGSNIFDDCKNLNFNVYDNGKYMGSKKNPYFVFVGVTNKNITQCQLHPNTKIILGSAFYECNSLTSITIPYGVTSIGPEAFYKCINMTNITIPDSVTSIGNAAFYDCYKLTSIAIPEGVTTIAYVTFHDCYRMTSITIPESVTRIESDAFDVCFNLTDVYYGGSKKQWDAISIDFGNDYLKTATIHFAADSGPQEDPNAKFASTGLSLGAFIGLQNAISKNALNGGNFDKAYFIYTQYTNNANGVLEQVATTQGEYLDMGTYFVADCAVRAKQMSDVYEITPVYVKNGITYYGATTTTSVKAEVAKKLANTKTDDKTKALCIAMLNYGTAAQTHFGYNLNDLANSELSAAQKVLPAFDDLNLTKTNIIPTTPFKPAKSGVSLGDVVYIQFLIKMSDIDANGALKYQIKGEDPVQIAVSDLEVYNGSYYIVNIPIKAKHVRTHTAIGLFDAQGARIYGYITCSVEAFVTTMKGSSTETLVCALMAYGDAAKAAFSDSDNNTGDDTTNDDSTDTPLTKKLAASIDMQGTSTRTSYSTSRTVHSANGITYTNDKASSITNNYDQTKQYSARAYRSSTIKIEYTGMVEIVFHLDDFSDGAYLNGFDGMTVAGATITRNGADVTITFESPVNVFQSAELLSQVRINSIDIYIAE